jgi:site-specific DNA-methyltransferase (adenine-specific)
MSEWKIVQGDCRDVLGTIEPGSVNLIVTDPPYNIDVDYGEHYNDSKPCAEYLAECESWIAAAVKTLAPEGSMWLLVHHRYSHHLRLMMENAGLHWRQTITWYETFGVCCKRKFGLCSRPLFWMVRDPKRFTFNDDAVRVPSARQTEYNDIRANPAGKIMDDVWKIPRVAGTFHERITGVPTQVPLELFRRVVGCSSNPDDRVLDPFSGSGTTGAVCVEMGRRFLGIELSPDFAVLSRRRLRSVTPCLAMMEA